MKSGMNLIDYFRLIILGLVFILILILADAHWDTQTCLNEFNQVYSDSEQCYRPSRTVDSVFANDDFWRLNFRREIKCTVFISEGKWLTHVIFESGTLNSEIIKESIYWN